MAKWSESEADQIQRIDCILPMQNACNHWKVSGFKRHSIIRDPFFIGK